MRITLDDHEFPLVTSTCPEEWSEAEMRDYFARMVKIHERDLRFAHIADVRKSGAMSNAQTRRLASEFQKEHTEVSARLCVCTAIVADSRLLRGAITAINWLTPPSYPAKTMASLDDARAYCQQMLAQDAIA